MRAVTNTDLPGLELLNRGKVRDIYAVGDDHLLLVASDRISAFDVVLPSPVPQKGIILTQLSIFWFDLLRDVTGNHLVETDVSSMPPAVRAHENVLRGRSLLVRRARVYPAECIARGFLLGSGWKDYQRTGSVCGIPLPEGLRKNHRFDPLFTPSTKAEVGHDENISFDALVATVGAELARLLRDLTLSVFRAACDHARERGIIICDTKFEWGEIDGKTLLVDEVLTPDSSRFWKQEDADRLLPDGDPPSYDKQVVRDHLETLDWNKKAPGPELPADVLGTARQRYVEIYERICGKPVRVWTLEVGAMAEVKILMVMGSESDFDCMLPAVEILESFEVGVRVEVASAHRTPQRVEDLIHEAEAGEVQVIIAAAGMAAHLAGVVAGKTILPVIGVPMDSPHLKGLDSLYSTVMMPPGIPVASVGIGKPGAKNAAYLALAILALTDSSVKDRLRAYRNALPAQIEKTNAKVQQRLRERS